MPRRTRTPALLKALDADGVAVTPTVILKIPVESLFDVLEDRPYMAADLIALFGRLLIDMRGHAQLPCESF